MKPIRLYEFYSAYPLASFIERNKLPTNWSDIMSQFENSLLNLDRVSNLIHWEVLDTLGAVEDIYKEWSLE
jgi:hypothetical protein